MLKKLKAWIKGLFKKEKKDERTLIERRIDEIAKNLKFEKQGTEKYDRMVEELKLLIEANAKLKEKVGKLDTNVVFNGVVAFLQIILILIWEERHVIRSEATKFMTKLIGRK